MDLIDIFHTWDKSRAERSRFKLKPMEEISNKDSPYKRELKSIINYRLERRLSREDLALALNLNPETVARIERFECGENWSYVYAMIYIFMRYEEHLLSQKGFVFTTDIVQ